MIKRYYKPESSFIYIKLSSIINDASLLRHLKELNRENFGRIELLKLYDLRDISSESNLSLKLCLDVAETIAKSENLIYMTGKLAFLVSNSFQLNLVRAFARITTDTIVHSETRIFYDLKEAVEFLDTTESFAEIEEFLISTGEYTPVHEPEIEEE